MLELTDHYWFWTFRYADNKELAILVATADERFSGYQSTIRVMDLIPKHKLVDTSRIIYSSGVGSAEWKTWVAFDLCPLIEVYASNHVEPVMLWRRVEP